MKAHINHSGLFIGLAAILALGVSAGGAVITDAEIVPTTAGMVPSGNGTLDLIMFGSAGGGGVTDNEVTGFNGDDANTDPPSGGSTTMSESYITSIGELRDFYELNFPDGSGGSLVSQIALFVDLTESGTVKDIKLDTLRIVIDYNSWPGPDVRNDPLGNDISTAVQNSTGSGFTGGTIVASLDASPKTLPENVSGAGFADYYILTGVNPFDGAFSDSTRVLVFWESHDHDNGGETIFLSGEVIPEPGTLALLGLGSVLMLIRRQRRRIRF